MKDSFSRNVTEKQAFAFVDIFVPANTVLLSSSSEALDDGVITVSTAGRGTYNIVIMTPKLIRLQ